MLGAMNFGFPTYQGKSLLSTVARSNSNTNRKEGTENKWKLIQDEKVRHLFEIAKQFINTGHKPNTDIINKLLGIRLTQKELVGLLNSPTHEFGGKSLKDHRKVIAKLRSLGKKYKTYSGIYI